MMRRGLGMMIMVAIMMTVGQSVLTPDTEYHLASDNKGWNLKGSASYAQPQGLYLNPPKTQSGAVWHAKPIQYHDWEILFDIVVQGHDGEGLVMFLADRILDEGEMFGSDHRFKGLAVVFDSTDNDGLNNNPAVAAHMFNNEFAYDESTDGISHQLGGCIADYTNKERPVAVKVAYSKSQGELGVYLDLKGHGTFQRCLHVTDIEIPSSGYLGFSAGGKEKADAHYIDMVRVFGDGGDEKFQLDFQSADLNPSESLMSLDHLLHSKIDVLLHHNSNNAVSAQEFGEALDEIENNVLESLSRHVYAVMRPVEIIRQIAADSALEMNGIRGQGLLNSNNDLEMIKTVLSELQTKGTPEDPIEDRQAMFTAAGEGIKAELRQSFLKYDKIISGSWSSQCWSLVLILQTVLCIGLAFRSRKSKSYHY